MVPRRTFDGRKVLEDSLWIASASVFGGLALFAVNLLLARSFGPEPFARFRIVISGFSFAAALIELGIGPTLVKHLAQFEDGRAHDLVRKALAARGLVFAAVVLAALAARGTLAELFLDGRAHQDLVVAGAVFLALMSFEILKPVAQGFHRFRLYSAATYLTFTSIGVLSYLLGRGGGVAAAVIGWGLGYLVGNLPIFGWMLRGLPPRAGRTVDFGDLLVRYGLPSHLALSLIGLEALVVPAWSLVYGPREIAALAFSMLFYRGILTVCRAAGVVLFPKFSTLASDPAVAERHLRRALWLYASAAVAAAPLLAWAAPFLISAVDARYLPAVPIFRLLVVYGFASGSVAILNSFHAGLARLKNMLWLNLAQQTLLFLVTWVGLRWIAP